MNRTLRRIKSLKDMLSLILGYLGLALLLAGAALGLAILHYTTPKRNTTRGIPSLRLPLSKP